MFKVFEKENICTTSFEIFCTAVLHDMLFILTLPQKTKQLHVHAYNLLKKIMDYSRYFQHGEGGSCNSEMSGR